MTLRLSDPDVSLPPTSYDDSALGILNPEIDLALSTYLEAFRSYLATADTDPKVVQIIVSGYVDHEEDFQQLIVNFWSNLDAGDAFHFWESFDTYLEGRLPDLDEWSAGIISTKISTNVQWKI